MTTDGMLRLHTLRQGEPGQTPLVLLHGFPYDARAYDAVVPPLAAAGARVIVPWLRGFGPTRFLSDHTPRSGEQAALGRDLLALLDALRLGPAVLAGYDWGGRAAVDWLARLASGGRFDPEARHLETVARVIDRIYGR